MLLALLACTGGPHKDGGEPACVPDTGTGIDPACTCEAPAVTIGGGEDAYEAVTDGAPATMVHGPQGGWHVLASARFDNLSELVTIHYWIDVPAREATVSDNEYRVVMVKDETCGGYYPGMFGYLDVSALASADVDTPPELLAGLELVLHMEVSDVDGRAASDTLHVIAALDPVDEPDTGG